MTLGVADTSVVSKVSKLVEANCKKSWMNLFYLAKLHFEDHTYKIHYRKEQTLSCKERAAVWN